MKTEAYFIGHCDHEHCDLGVFQYECPCCAKTVDDYDIWWLQDNIYYEEPHKFQCDECGEILIVEWDEDELLYYVSPMKS